MRRLPVSVSTGIPASPRPPLPLRILIITVSAWSAAWCPSNRCSIPSRPHASVNTRYRASRARTAIAAPLIKSVMVSSRAAMPRAARLDTVSFASTADSARKPWSTTNARRLPPRSRAHASANNANAILSAPPETPAARRGARSNGPSAAIAAPNRTIRPASSIAARSLAARSLPSGGDAFAQVCSRLRELRTQLIQRTAGCLLFIDADEGIRQP